MNKFQQIPQPFLIFLVMLAGSLFIYFSNPPGSVCDVEKDTFVKSMSGLIFKQSERATSKESLFVQSYKQCIAGNSVGACLEFFQTIDSFSQRLNATSHECFYKIKEMEEVISVIQKAIRLFAILAWGAIPLESGADLNFQWLAQREFGLYCKLKSLYFKVNEDENGAEEELWYNFTRQIVSELPKSKELTIDEALRMSIFTVSCDKIL